MKVEKVVHKRIRGRTYKSRINADVSGVIAGNLGEMGSHASVSTKSIKKRKQRGQTREGGENPWPKSGITS
jgi:hypothetical protein